MEERSENASGTVGSNVRNIFEPPSRWYSKDERPYAQRRAKLTSPYLSRAGATSRDGATRYLLSFFSVTVGTLALFLLVI
jgi:hypothetical protein